VQGIELSNRKDPSGRGVVKGRRLDLDQISADFEIEHFSKVSFQDVGFLQICLYVAPVQKNMYGNRDHKR